jgi:hypothetical protein
MEIVHFYDPKLELNKLKYETVSMIRVSREVSTIKSLVCCYEILDITDQINRPWDSHPGKLYADLAALWELQERTRSLLVYQDPSAERIHAYNQSVKKLVHFWRMAVANGQGVIQI